MPNHMPRGSRMPDYLIVGIARPKPAQAWVRRWPKVASLALGAALAAGAVVQWSAAQRGDAPRITVAPEIVARPAAQTALPIEVGPREAVPSKSFVRMRGLPTSVSLSVGHAIAPGAWAVPLFGLPTLKAIVPAGVSGRNEITISLVGNDGTTLARSKMALVIAAPPPPEPPERPPPRTIELAPPAQAARPPVRPAAPSPRPVLPAETRASAERMLAQGTKHLSQGNIGAARMFFRRAADAGLADGALRLGETYDPAELDRLDALVSLTPDREEARKWYERARELGSPQAEGRLARLLGR